MGARITVIVCVIVGCAMPIDAQQITCNWTDNPIVAGQTPIRAEHINEIRACIDRILAGGGTVTPPPPPPPTGGRTSFGPGQWLVNTEIEPGRYFTDPVGGCYWERQSGTSGSLDDVLANEFTGFDSGQEIVDIEASDHSFEADAECGMWSQTRGVQVPSGTIPPGRWLVGDQVAVGSYESSVNEGCYVEWLSGFDGTFSDIISNDFIDVAGRRRLTIRDSHVGFYTDEDCGTWRVSTSTANADAVILDESSKIEINTVESNRLRNQNDQR